MGLRLLNDESVPVKGNGSVRGKANTTTGVSEVGSSGRCDISTRGVAPQWLRNDWFGQIMF